MSDTQRLIFSIIEFLNSEIQSSSVSEDERESLEVATECLERVYNLSVTNPSDVSKFHYEEPLKDIFKKATKLQTTSKSPTEEDKAKAEKLKVKGNELMKEEKYTDALNTYSKAIEYDWTNAVYLCNRAAAYSKLSRHEEAVEDCKKALVLDPKYGKAYGRMGAAYVAVQKYKDAKECYSKAIEIDPNCELYHNGLRMVEDTLNESADHPSSASQSSRNPGGPNILNSLFSNPAVMNMAQQFMANPQMQQMVSNMMGGAVQGNQPRPEANSTAGTTGTERTTEHGSGAPGGAGGFSNIFQFATQMAQQLQQTNPNLVNDLRDTMQQVSGDGGRSDEDPKDKTQEGKK